MAIEVPSKHLQRQTPNYIEYTIMSHIFLVGMTEKMISFLKSWFDLKALD